MIKFLFLLRAKSCRFAAIFRASGYYLSKQFYVTYLCGKYGL
jgi:hypothetical protein